MTRCLSEYERNAGSSLRGDNRLKKAFLETAAPLGANVVLVLEIAMGHWSFAWRETCSQRPLSATRLVPIHHRASEPGRGCCDDDSFVRSSCASQGTGQAG